MLVSKDPRDRRTDGDSFTASLGLRAEATSSLRLHILSRFQNAAFHQKSSEQIFHITILHRLPTRNFYVILKANKKTLFIR